MGYNKICFLICIVLFFISISCVSAGVDNDTVDNLSSVSDDLEINNEVYLASQKEDILSANEGSYFNLYISTLFASNSLDLNNDYKFSSSDRYYDGIPITKAITINGNGHSIDGDGQARIFSITSSNVVLKNIVFKNALYDHGGAIYWKALKGTVSNCTFINCTAYDGAAIFSLNTSLTLQNNNFLDNYAYFSGGAVYQMYGDLSVNNCYFYNNGATDGGAICIDAYNSLKLSNSNFTYNYAYRYGGAVATSFNSVLTCSNCKFNFNEAYKGDDVYNILLSEILDTSSDVGSLIEYLPDEVTSLPEYYNLRKEGYLTSIKDQGTDGNCWSFAAIAALESALLKATGVSYDFSENNLKNLAAKFSDYGKNIEVNDGGNYWMAISYFASWLGPINESYDYYYDDGNLFSDFFMPLLHIQDVAFVKRTTVSDLNVIKKAIMMYGAVATNYHSDSKYNSGANIYCPDDLTTNHAVAIIGWNDTYSKNNFKTTPEGDGAWIIKNSWGDDSGDGGYYYISYYDKTLALDKNGYSYVFVFNNTVDYERIYQNEFMRTGNFWWDSNSDNINASEIVSNAVWFKNIYTAKDDEFLAAVSTWFDYNINFDLTINVTHNGKSSVYSQSGFTKAGYHTIKLNKYIPLQKGDTFSITFKFKGIYWFAVYRGSDGLRNFSTPGISYSSWNGVDWRDLYDYRDVACIKGFTISKVNSTLTILNFDNPKVSDSFNVAVKVTDQFGNFVNNGNVTFMFNNTKYVLNTTDGIANLTLKLNKSGIYNLNCTFNAHNYYSSTNSLQFQVLKHTSDLIVNVNNINYNQNLTVNVTLSSNATGKVFIKIDDSNKANVTVTNNKASHTFSNLKAGNYKLNVTYYGDEYYYSISKNTTFKVNQISSSVVISNIANIVHGNDVNITYTITNGATGNINVSIYKNNILIISNLTNKKSITFSNLDVGTYTVIVKYLGDNNFIASNKSSTFNIFKSTSSISINDINNISYGGVINIVPNLVNGTTGNYTLFYNSNILKTGSLTNNIQFKDLNAGNYTLTLINYGDSNHNSSNASVKFEVFKINSNLNIAPISAITYGNDLIVSVTLHSSYTGNVKVSIFKDNKLISNKTVNNLKATFKNLNASEYNVTVEILNDTNYYNTFAKTLAYVNKANSKVGVVAPLNITYGDDFTANITLINATNSIYNLYYNNNLLKSENASDKLTFTKLTYGNYTLDLINPESNNYKESSYTFNFKVLKADVILSLNVLNVIYNNNITIPFNINATGNVNVLIYKNKQLLINKTADVTDKEFKILLNAGDYDVVLNYLGDLNHNPSSIKSNFTVYKATSSIEIKKLVDITYGDDLNIEVTLTNGSATHYELIQNNNIIKTGNNLNIADLAAGEYTIQIYNLGDENHNQSIVKSNFKVNKLMPIITINPINDIIYNKIVTAVFNINVPSSINIILLKENILISNQSSNSRSVDFNNLDSGNYTLIVEYQGDNNHTYASKNQSFKVFKAMSSVSVEGIKNITYGDTLTLVGNLVNGSTGYYELIYDDEVIKTDDLINLIFSDLNAGNYTINLYNNGDKNHNSSSTSYNFTVKKATLTLTISEINNVTYKNTVNINFNIPNVVVSVFKGDVLVSNNTISDNSVSFDNLDSGEYKVNVSYLGDINHNPISATSLFNVFNASSSIGIINLKNSTYGEVLSFGVNLVNGSQGRYELIYNNQIINQNSLDNIQFRDLNAGKYTIKFYNYGDKNHNMSSSSYNFTVFKATPVLVVDDIVNITYSDTFNLLFDINVVGSVNVSIFKGNDYITNKIAADGSVSFDNLDAGFYRVNVSYGGSENYNSVDVNSTFTVFKASSSSSITNIKNITYGDNLTIDVKLINGSNGYYELMYNNEIIQTNNLVNIMFTNLNAGNYTLNVYNEGDKNHNSSTISYNFTVNKTLPKLTIFEIDNVVYNNSVNINFNLDTSTGNVKISIFKEDILISNKTISAQENIIIFDNLNAGEYNAFIEYLGDNNHLYISKNQSFKVFKADSSVDADGVKDIVYGDTLTPVANLVNGSDGKYQLEFNNEIIREGDVNNIVLNNLNAGDYTLYVYNDGDINHNSSSDSYDFTVFKSTPSILIKTIPDITYNDTLNVLFDINVDGIINVSIFKDEEFICYKDTTNKTVFFDNLDAGVYRVNVRYGGSENYNSIDANSTFSVFKASSSIDIVGLKNITYGDVLSIDSVLVNGSTGYYELIYDNSVINYGNLENIYLDKLDAGNYTIKVYNDGDDNHNSSSAIFDFSVFKADPVIVVNDIVNVTYSNTLNVMFDIDVFGSVDVSIFKDNLFIINKTTVDNFVSFDNLNAGFYDVVVTYLGDDNHNVVSVNSSFTIFKASSSIGIVGLKNITYGDALTLNTNLVNGSFDKFELINNEKVIDETSDEVIVFDNLTAGNYTIIVYNFGDENHNQSMAKYNFTVFKATPVLVINDITNITYNNTFNLLFDINVGGSVNVSIFEGDKYITNKITDNKSVLFDNLDAGVYRVNVGYGGSENYNGVDVNSTFCVFKASSSIGVVGLKNITFGDVLSVDSVLVNGSCGYYELIYDNAVIKSGNLENIYLDKLNAGNYTIKVYNDGDDNHNSSSAIFDFSVFKADPVISVNDIVNVTYSNTLNVMFDIDVFGSVDVSIFKDNLFIINKTTVDNFVSFDNLNAGFYDVVVTYLGDDNHNVIGVNSSFAIFKASSSIGIVGLKNITYGDTLTLNTNLVNGSFDKFELINNEKVIDENNDEVIVFDNLTAGNYTIIVYNFGDDNHNSSSAMYNFTVFKATPVLVINDITNITYNNTLNISFSLDVGGNVTISIFKDEKLIINKITDFNNVSFDNLGAGVYRVNVRYGGSGNYNGVDVNSTFCVFKASSSIGVVGLKNIIYGDELSVGSVLVNGSCGYYELIHDNAIIKSGDLENIYLDKLNAGNYTIKVYNDGDDNHNSSSGIYNFTVFKATPVLVVDDISNIIYNDTLNVSFDINVVGNVDVSIFKDNLFIINKTTEDNFVSFDNLNAGSYNISVVYLGDDNHNVVDVNLSFTVFKASSSIDIVDLKNITYDYTLIINPILVNGSAGYYNLIYNNEVIKSGNFENIYFNKLNVGNYSIYVFNYGDLNHNPSNLSANFSVHKSIPVLDISKISNVQFNTTFKVAYNLNVKGNFRVSIYKNDSLVYQIETTKHNVNFNSLPIGEYNLVVEYFGDSNYFSTTENITFYVVKAPSAIIMNNLNDLYYGDKLVINPTFINGTGYWEVYYNNHIIDDLNNLNTGSYTIKLYNIGDENHTQSKLNYRFTINKANPIVKLNKINNVVYGDNVTISFTSPFDCDFEVRIQKNNKVLFREITNETYLSVPNLGVGSYNLIITSQENSNVNQVINLFNFQISKASSSTKIISFSNITYGEVENINVEIINSAQAHYKLINNGVEVSNGFIDGEISFNNLSSGNYTFIAVGEGDENHTESYDEVFFTVYKKQSELLLNPINDIYFNQSLNITYTCLDNITGFINVKIFNNANLILNKTFDVFDEISINNLKTGIYKINISYLGDVNHVSVSYLEDIKVNSVISESNIIVLTNKDYSVIENSSEYVKKYTISFENKTVNVVMDTRCEFTVYVNGNKFINKTNLKLYSHDLGAYINIKVKLDDKNDVGDEFESVVKIKSSSAISYDDNKISLNLPSDAKGKVILTINNKTYESALNNLNIFNLTDGDYNYSIAYSGDDKYESFTYEGNVSVINTYKTNITLSSNIVGYNGNVIVKVNGEGNLNNYLITVSGIGADKLLKLDKKGQCILSLRNIKPGSYKIKIVFNGDNKYLSSSLISKITITKAKVKLIAKKKTFKANVKVKKYKIILKGVKKAKVILKIKGKKYSAKTNNKGKAIFKLKKLNIKGKYKAKIQFRGNKYYNSAKKTVIIKIK